VPWTASASDLGETPPTYRPKCCGLHDLGEINSNSSGATLHEGAVGVEEMSQVSHPHLRPPCDSVRSPLPLGGFLDLVTNEIFKLLLSSRVFGTDWLAGPGGHARPEDPYRLYGSISSYAFFESGAVRLLHLRVAARRCTIGRTAVRIIRMSGLEGSDRLGAQAVWTTGVQGVGPHGANTCLLDGAVGEGVGPR
jgi:hypothetical protein